MRLPSPLAPPERVYVVLRERDRGHIWATCIHEAGHSVLHVLEGHTLESVYLQWRVSNEGWSLVGGACVPRTGRLSAISLLAGEAAEEMAGVDRHIREG